MCANYAKNSLLKTQADDTLNSGEFINDTNEFVDPRSTLRGDHLTWGATPLFFTGDQMVVFEALKKRIHDSVPESTPDDVKQFVLQHFMSRFFERQDRNAKSFHDRDPNLVLEDLDELSQEAVIDAVFGASNPNDLLKTRENLVMPSIELGRLTHPFGTHMETLEEMRQAVDFAIENNDGDLINDDTMTTYGVDGGHIRDKGDNIELGFLMKRKRIRGILPDGTVIIERSTFVLRVDDKSPLDQDIAQQFRDIKIDNNPLWNKQVMEIINTNKLIPKLLNDNEFDIAIPLSTTAYAYNPQLVYELEVADKRARRARKCANGALLSLSKN